MVLQQHIENSKQEKFHIENKLQKINKKDSQVTSVSNLLPDFEFQLAQNFTNKNRFSN